MPTKTKTDKESIIQAAFEIISNEGAMGLNARSLAKRLKISTQPIFTRFKSMDEVRSAVICKVNKIHDSYLLEGLGEDNKLQGFFVAYIRFAHEKPRVFKSFYMCQSRNALDSFEIDGKKDILLKPVMEKTGLGEAKARALLEEMFILAYGLAAIVASQTIELSYDKVKSILDDAMTGIIEHLCKE